jgi:hypothetical protein
MAVFTECIIQDKEWIITNGRTGNQGIANGNSKTWSCEISLYVHRLISSVIVVWVVQIANESGEASRSQIKN